MICRIWHGYTTPTNADEYERVVRTTVIPAMEARSIPGHTIRTQDEWTGSNR